MTIARQIHEQHSTVVNLSQRAFAMSVAASVYDDCRKQEQRILREMNRLQEQLNKCREDRLKYGRMIGVE